MTKEIEAAMQIEIEQLPWVSATTKEKALEKLHSIVNKIGYPEKMARLQFRLRSTRRMARSLRQLPDTAVMLNNTGLNSIQCRPSPGSRGRQTQGAR